MMPTHLGEPKGGVELKEGFSGKGSVNGVQSGQQERRSFAERHGCRGGSKVVGFGVGDRIWISGFVVGLMMMMMVTMLVNKEQTVVMGVGVGGEEMRLWDDDEEEEWMENLENDEEEDDEAVERRCCLFASYGLSLVVCFLFGYCFAVPAGVFLLCFGCGCAAPAICSLLLLVWVRGVAFPGYVFPVVLWPLCLGFLAS
ncbi:hypothetical protein Q3G72_025199 [Acer saccharum]|nr:hypothetical protein Q3G72_025199 [Acer saccharum]